MSLKLEGHDVVLKMIADLPNTVKQSADEIMDNAAEEILSEAQRLAPVRTGYLRDSLYHKVIALCRHEVGAEADYAPHVEFGTMYMRAQPFLRPAADIVGSKMDSLIKDVLSKYLSGR